MRRYLFLLVNLFLAISLYARVEIRGSVSDPDGTPLQGIIIRLYDGDKIKAFSNSKKDGAFILKTDTLSLPARITFASKSFAAHEETVYSLSDTLSVILYPQQYELQEVVVRVPRVRTKGDTITYDVASYTGNKDRSIEDVIKKLPGIEVSETGQISYDGEPINNFYIEGLNLMGKNYAVASQNIRPQDISSVSIYERHQPKKALKDVEESKQAALNLKLKKGSMLKPVGYVKAAGGEGDEFLWGGALYTMFISPKNQTIVSAKGNNSGNIYLSGKKAGDKAYPVFSNTPFGYPSISSNRYLRNKSGYFTANTLFKLKEDLTLSANTSYGIDHDDFDSYSSTEYLASNLENPLYSERVDNGLRKHSVAASAKVEKNSDKVYVMDKFSFQGKFHNNDYDIFNTSDINQSLNSDNYSFQNDFSTVLNFNKKVFKLNSTTSFSNTPLNRIAAYDPQSGEMSIWQRVTGRSFHNRESTGYSLPISRRSTIGMDLAFNIDHDSFNSLAFKGEETAGLNDISGHKLILSASPYYKYVIYGKFIFSLTLPIEWRNQKYTDLASGKVYRHDKPYVNANLSMTYKFNQFNDITLEGAWKHDTGDISNFIENPVYTTFRNITTMGNGELKTTLSKSASLNYSRRDIMNGFYLRGMLSYNRSTTNSLPVYDVSQEGTSSSSLNKQTHTSITNFMGTAIKHLNNIHSRLSLNLTGVWMQRESMRSSNLIDIKNSSYIVTFTGETDQLNDRLSLAANLSYSLNRQTFGGFMPANNLSEYSVNGSLSFFPIKKLEIYGKVFYNRSQISEDNYKSNLFVDAGIKYSIRKFDIELTGRNLTNMKKYEYTIYNALDITTYSYSLRPIEGILSVRYNF